MNELDPLAGVSGSDSASWTHGREPDTNRSSVADRSRTSKASTTAAAACGRKTVVKTGAEHPAASRAGYPPGAADQPLTLAGAELRRRIWHMTPGLLAFVLPLIPHPDPLPPQGVREVAGLAVVLTVVVLATFRAIARPGERHWVLNIVSYPASVVVTLALFPAHPEFAAVVLVVLAFGDGSATVAGILFGSRPLPWNRQKTWAGTLTFCLLAGPLAVLAYWNEARPAVSLATAAACGLAAVLAGAAAESLPVRLTDNLRVGVAAATGVVLSHLVVLGW